MSISDVKEEEGKKTFVFILLAYGSIFQSLFLKG